MARFYFQYIFLFMGLGIFYPYLAVYLGSDLNFSGSQIGIITSIPSIIGVIMLPLWGIISDITKKEKLILWINVFISMAAMIAYANTNVFIIVLIIASILELFRLSLIPLSDNISLSYCKTNNKNYGSIRGMGSLGYVLGAFIAGQCIKIVGNEKIIFYLFAISSILCLFIVPYLSVKRVESQKISIKNDLPILIKNKGYILILLIAGSTMALTDAIGSYQGMYLVELGASPELIGILTLFMAAPEIYIMAKSRSVLKKYGYSKMFLFGIIALFIRWIVYITTNSTAIFIITTALHAFTMCFVMVSSFEFIKKEVPERMNATAMTIFSAFLGITGSIYKLVFGNIIDLFGMKYIFVFSLFISLLSLIVIHKINKHMKGNSEEIPLVEF